MLVLCGCEEKETTPTKIKFIKIIHTPKKNVECTKEEALNFSLQIVNTYFTKDYLAFISFLTPKTYTLEGEGPFDKQFVTAKLQEEPFPFGRDYSEYTLSDYLENYNPKILSFEEYALIYPHIANLNIDGWSPNEDDFLFVGYETKPGKSEFMWDDLLVFMVTCENNEWRLIAFSG